MERIDSSKSKVKSKSWQPFAAGPKSFSEAQLKTLLLNIEIMIAFYSFGE